MAIYRRSSYRGSELGENAYIRAIAFFTLIEGLCVAGGARISFEWEASWIIIIVSFVVALAGIFMFTGSDDASVSGVGVTVMSIALGVMIGPAVNLYEEQVIIQAIVATGGIMIVMSIAGLIYPGFFQGIGPYLLGGLSFLLVALFSQAIFITLGIEAANTDTINTILAWGGIVVFTGLVGYDWAKAMDESYTLNNAIDASGGLVLDAVNLFIRLLEIFGNSSSDD